MISVIRIYILHLHAVLIKQPGPASHYVQVSNMFTVNFIFCPSKANSWRHNYLALEMSLSNVETHGKLQRCQTLQSYMPITAETMQTSDL